MYIKPMARIPRWTQAQLIVAVAESKTWKEVAARLGITSNSIHLRRHADVCGISYAHFSGRAWKGGEHTPRVADDDIFVEHSTASPSLLRTRYLRLESGRACAICGITEWCGLPAPLQLDHTNGVNNDNRLKNLRLLCANCHAQTETFGGRNRIGKGRSHTARPR
ncbi:hypothetical protein SAMN05421684_1833 [Asanoa ishikariensis]|uniref:HNH endonuclease n=1 Tax=Asanoa ishikariensis TaxID=137265 RepID=A0A1H3N5N1_9ACTN|nr:hypothetical protein SAMN05421684_1833 [Asanoa ishikariensis]